MIDFGCGSLTENVDFLYVIADVVAYGIQMDSKYHFQQAMCKNFTDVPETFLYQVYVIVDCRLSMFDVSLNEI